MVFEKRDWAVEELIPHHTQDAPVWMLNIFYDEAIGLLYTAENGVLCYINDAEQ